MSIVLALRNGLLIAFLVAVTGWISYIATIHHGLTSGPRPVVIAVLVTIMGTVPPLFFGRLLGNSAARQLAVVAWRLGIMLPAVAIAARYVADERKCYLIALLACYFVSLPLESWLLIRDVRRRQATDA